MQKLHKPLSIWESEYYATVIFATVTVVIGAVFLFLQASGLSPNGEFLQWSNFWISESKGFLANTLTGSIPN